MSKLTEKFIVILGRAFCNSEGAGIEYSSDLFMHDKRKAAIDEGFNYTKSDDFNIGVVRDRTLVSLDWMNEVVESDPAKLSGIAEQLCLE